MSSSPRAEDSEPPAVLDGMPTAPEAPLPNLVEMIPQLVWTAQADGRFDYLNQHWLRYTGLTLQQGQSMSWLDLKLHADDLEVSQQAWRDALKQQIPFDIECRIQHQDGSYRWFKSRSAAQRDSAGAIVKWFGTSTDIDVCKRQQQDNEQLLATERTARVAAEHAARTSDDLIALLSHELRTPLNAIVGWAQILSSENIDPLKLKKGVEVIARNAALQTRMVNDLLDMSHIMTGKLRLDMQELDFSKLAASAVASAQSEAAAREVTLVAEIASDTALWGDPARLQQILWHLLSNAIRLAPRRSMVIFKLEALAGTVTLTISDSGQCIASPARPPALATDGGSKPSASDLGLALAGHLVALHGGHIYATKGRQPNEAALTVLLPQTAAQRELQE